MMPLLEAYRAGLRDMRHVYAVLATESGRLDKQESRRGTALQQGNSVQVAKEMPPSGHESGEAVNSSRSSPAG